MQKYQKKFAKKFAYIKKLLYLCTVKLKETPQQQRKQPFKFCNYE